MKLKSKFSMMLVILSAVLCAGIIIPGFLIIRQFELDEAKTYLTDRNRMLVEKINNSYRILEQSGVLEINSYVRAGKEEFRNRLQNGPADPRISVIIFDSDGKSLFAKYSRNSAFSGEASQIRDENQQISGSGKYDSNSRLAIKTKNLVAGIDNIFVELVMSQGSGKQFAGRDPKNAMFVVNRNNNWHWSVVTHMSEKEIFSESWAYLQFVLAISALVLAVVFALYAMLTGQVRRKMDHVTEHLGHYRMGNYQKRMVQEGSDELGMLQKSINSMINRIEKESANRKATEMKLASAKAEAEKASQAKSIFLANLSHEIRNPLNAIMGFADVLSVIGSDEKQTAYANNILSASRNLTSTLDDILDLTKVERGLIKLSPEIFNLRETVEAAFNLFALQGANKGLKMSYYVSDDIPKYLIGDKSRLSQIITNLVHNSVKFTDEGSIKINLNMVSESDLQCTLKLEVIDTGYGIDENAQTTIFEAFEQSQTVIQKNAGGIGLGLSIIKGIIEVMGGHIKLDSSLGQGSRFIITIPFQIAEAQHVDLETINDIPDRHTDHVRILVAEDDLLNQTYLGEILKNNLIEYEVVGDGEAAIEKISAESFDLVLMDVRMPKMNGDEAIRIIRNSMAIPKNNIPIIAVTANAYAEDIERLLEAGATACVSKPYDSKSIVKTIYKTLRESGEGDKFIREISV